MKMILTDCDGCLLLWEDAFHEWMNDRGYTKVVSGTYDLAVAYNIHTEKKHDVISEFNTSARMGWLTPFRDSVHGVSKLKEAGYDFHVITSFGTDPYAIKLRQYNLDCVFGKNTITKLSCLNITDSKKETLEPYRDSGLWWIEDHPNNAIIGADMGLRVILLDHPYNQYVDDPRITRVSNWEQIVNTILKDE